MALSAPAVLRAAAAWTTPLLPDDYLGLVNPLWTVKEPRGRVVEVRRETADAVTLVVRPGWGWAPHQAGQWIRVGVQIQGVWHSRSYSLTTAASETRTGTLTITVKALDGGVVSRHLVEHAGPGTVLRLSPPQGEFVLPTPHPDRMLFLTGGSGITPVMGMLRTLTARSADADIVHVHSALRADDVIFGPELRTMSLPNYRLHEQHTDTTGFFTLSQLDVVCPDWRGRDTWACGPTGMLDDIERHWADHGVEHRLHVERFRPPTFAAPDADGGTVTFARTGRDCTAPAGTPLLEVGENAGIAMPSGCRMGICFSCVTPLRAGQVRDLRTGEVHGEEGDLVQTCVSAAAGTVELDI